MRKILIIEDDRIISGIYQRKFTLDGYQVELATDGQTGLVKIQSFHPDLIVLDIMLPRLNGLELLRTIRNHPDFATLPVIVFSNAYQTSIIDEAWKSGATMVLMKANTNPKKLSEAVAELLAATAPPPAPVEPASVPEADAAMAEHRRQFLAALPGFKTQIRELHQAFLAENDRVRRLALLHDLWHQLHLLTGNAGALGFDLLARMSETFEALVRDLHDKPNTVTVSSTRTTTQTLHFLNTLLDLADKLPPLRDFQPHVLVVDDEELARRAALHAVEKAGLSATGVANAAAALIRAREEPHDLFVLDVDMPGQSGFELCARLRALPEYKETPIIFVTSLSDFQNRAKSTLSGGNDLIAKPYPFVELSVKALTYLFKSFLLRYGLL